MTRAKESITPEDLEKYRAMGQKHLILPFAPRSKAYSPEAFKLFVKEDGCRLTDSTGKVWLDAYASLMYKNIGYGRKEVNDAIYEQLQQLSSMVYGTPSLPSIKLAKKLADITPGDLSVVFFGSNGGDAVETGVKVARHYQRLCGYTNRYKVIVRKREYHGTNFGTMALAHPIKAGTTLLCEDYGIYGPLMPGMLRVAPPYCYRCEYGLSYPGCDLKCARDVEDVILKEGPETIALFMSTPISAHALASVPPPEYWPIIRSICDKYGILLQTDCIVCGFGRTGKMFAVENFGIVPDILSMAKGITSGYAPLSATIISSKVADKFEPNTTFNHIYTFGAHPASCAAALVNIHIMEREKLVENSAVVGKYLLKKLQALSDHPMVGDVRGLGLFVAIEYVKNKKTREPFTDEETKKINAKIVAEGLLTRTGLSATSLLPPLIFTKSDADEAVAIIERAIIATEKELSIKK
jgi:adenosylmethionine-8-amino-7-oxononanoate aminotransferase